ncbi:hypothetical protein TRVL_07800 [Trypanosoma vivax]|nr:hypothetical protein TRVL_07800 [Trypanosoma vivax]
MTSNAAGTQQSRSSAEAHPVRGRKAAYTCTARRMDEEVRHALCQRAVRCYLFSLSLSRSAPPSAARVHSDQSIPRTAWHPGRTHWQAFSCTSASLANTTFADGQLLGTASDSDSSYEAYGAAVAHSSGDARCGALA